MRTQLKLVVILLFLVCIKVNSQIVVYTNNNVGVKTTTTPTEALEVNGNAKATSFIGSGANLTNIPCLDTTKTRTANYIYAGPNGTTGKPTFRALTSTDLPSIPWTKLTGTPTTVSGYGIADGPTTTTGYTITNSSTNCTIVSYDIKRYGNIVYMTLKFTSTAADDDNVFILLGKMVVPSGTVTCFPSFQVEGGICPGNGTQVGAIYITTSGYIYINRGISNQTWRCNLTWIL